MNLNESLTLAQKARHASVFLGNSSAASESIRYSTGSDYEISGGNISPASFILRESSVGGVFHRLVIPPQSLGESAALTGLSTSLCQFNRIDYGAAFEDLEKVRADNRTFLKVVAEVRDSKTIPESAALADRLKVLLDAYYDDYGQTLDAESLRTFVSFVSLHPELRRPIITATPDGNLFAEWKGNDGIHYLGLQFLPSRQVRYVAVRPNPKHNHYRIRSSGLVTPDQLVAEIAGHRVLDWAKRAK